VTYIATKLQFLISSFSVIVQVQRQTDTEMKKLKNNTLLCYFAGMQRIPKMSSAYKTPKIIGAVGWDELDNCAIHKKQHLPKCRYTASSVENILYWLLGAL